MRDMVICLVLIKGFRYVIRGVIGLIRKENMIFYSLVLSYKIHGIPVLIGIIFVLWAFLERLNYNKRMSRVISFGIYFDIFFIIISIIYMISCNLVVIPSRRFLYHLSFIIGYLIVDLFIIEKLDHFR